MNGGIATRSTMTLTSSRGLLTLKTLSFAFHVPLSPVRDSIVAPSAGSAPQAADAMPTRLAATQATAGSVRGIQPPEPEGRLRRPVRSIATLIGANDACSNRRTRDAHYLTV